MKTKPSRNRKEKAPEAAPADARSRFSELFDIPQAALAGVSQMELSGNREAVIDGCQAVLAYDETLIRLALRGMTASFHGRGLQIKVLTHDSAIIGGYLTRIEFSE